MYRHTDKDDVMVKCMVSSIRVVFMIRITVGLRTRLRLILNITVQNIIIAITLTTTQTKSIERVL